MKDYAANSLRPLIQKFPHDSIYLDDQSPLSFEQIAERLAQIPQEPISIEAVQVKKEVGELLSPKAAEPVSNDGSQTPFALLRSACLRLGEFLTALGASNRPR